MIYVEKLENGNVLLTPRELVNAPSPEGIGLTTVTLSCSGCTLLWFIDFLEEKENIPTEYPSDGRTYQASRVSGNVFLKDIRKGGQTSVVGFSSSEITNVLTELKSIEP
jgi:hypothetical protein